MADKNNAIFQRKEKFESIYQLLIDMREELEDVEANKEKREALTEAANCIQLKIPKKPKGRHVKPYDSYNDGWCPTCGTHIAENEWVAIDHCEKCGQALIWPKTFGDWD